MYAGRLAAGRAESSTLSGGAAPRSGSRTVRVTVPSRAPWTRHPRQGRAALAAVGADSLLLAQLLLNRRLRDPDARATFLDPGCPIVPALDAMAGLEAAIDRIERALDRGERIVVYGDYDVDGLSGTTLLQRALRALGGDVEAFIPHRDHDGYGLNTDALGRLSGAGAQVVITVDCGVTAVPEIAAANALGLDVIVTDHHEPPVGLPDAAAIVNPRRAECPYPFKQLAGAGVALKVAQAIVHRRLDVTAAAQIEPSLFELAALGTVSDVMPLLDENRAIVRHGLDALNSRPSPGIAALVERIGLARPWVDAVDIAFRIAPRLNAAGRIDDATVAQRLLAAADRSTADDLAEQLEALNGRRRELGLQALDEARDEVLRLGPTLPAAIVVTAPHPAGVLGLVAVRLVEETGRPVAVIERADGASRGSVRAPAGFNAIEAVNACADLLIRHGGHAGAAGFSIDPSLVPTFRERFIEAAERAVTSETPESGLVAECRLRPATIDRPLLDLLKRIGPFGAGCPEPLFESSNLIVREARVVGERHLRLRLFGEGRLLTGIYFGGADDLPALGSTVDVLYRVRANVWNGAVRADLQVESWRPAVG